MKDTCCFCFGVAGTDITTLKWCCVVLSVISLISQTGLDVGRCFCLYGILAWNQLRA
jgi:hypothetical protein